MRRILVLNFEWPPLGGGASPVSEALAQQLVASGEYSIDVITSGYKDLPQVEQLSPTYTIYRVPVGRKHIAVSRVIENALYLILGFWQARLLCSRHRYDVIHAHFIIPTGALAWALHQRYDIPYLLSSHGSDVLGYNERFSTLYQLLTWPWKMILRRATAVITPSKFLKEQILTAYPQLSAEHIVVIPHGIAPRTNKNITKLPIILTSGRLITHKRINDIIEALAATTEPWELHIAGDGPERSALERLAFEKNVPVVFHGWLDKSQEPYQDLFCKASIFVLPSRAESFSIVTAEALSAGCAIITTQSSGAAELAGEAAICIPSGDVVALRTALEHLMSDTAQRTKLQAHALLRVKAFTWERVVEQYKVLFEAQRPATHI